MPDASRLCPVCGTLLKPEPDLRVRYRESHRDATGTPHLQAAAVLGRFKCPGCGAWSERPLWEIRPHGRGAEQGEADAPSGSGDEDA